MLPYIHTIKYKLGPFTFQAFGLLVAIGVILGTVLIRKRAEQLKLNVDLIIDSYFVVLPGSFVISHLVSVIFYFPERIAKDPLTLIYFWEGISSFGGFLGGLLLGYFYFKKHKVPVLPYLEAIAFGFVPGFTLGRFGCTVAHDHPGAWFTYPLNVGAGHYGFDSVPAINSSTFWIGVVIIGIILGIIVSQFREKPMFGSTTFMVVGLCVVLFGAIHPKLNVILYNMNLNAPISGYQRLPKKNTLIWEDTKDTFRKVIKHVRQAELRRQKDPKYVASPRDYNIWVLCGKYYPNTKQDPKQRIRCNRYMNSYRAVMKDIRKFVMNGSDGKKVKHFSITNLCNKHYKGKRVRHDCYSYYSGVFSGGRRFDLGILGAFFFIFLCFLYWLTARGKPRPIGFHLALWFTLYAPVRFLLDSQRTADLLYWGLTPGQYMSIITLFFGIFFFKTMPKQRWNQFDAESYPELPKETKSKKVEEEEEDDEDESEEEVAEESTEKKEEKEEKKEEKASKSKEPEKKTKVNKSSSTSKKDKQSTGKKKIKVKKKKKKKKK